MEKLGPLRLSVQDFGPIAKADIELRPLTVFVGRSNTGKSYMATLIHALHQAFQVDGFAQGWRRGVWPTIYPEKWMLEGEMAFYAIVDEVKEWLSDVLLEPDAVVTWNSLADADVPEATAENVHQLCVDNFQGCDVLVAELERCFGDGAEISSLVRNQGGLNARAALLRRYYGAGEPFDSVGFDFLVERNGQQTSGAFLEYDEPFCIAMKGENSVPKKSTLKRSFDERYESLEYHDWVADVVCEVLVSFTRDLVGPMSRPSYYLPADRAGVIHMNRAVVGLLLRESASRRREPARGIPTLTGITVDFLAELVEMSGSPHAPVGKGEKLAQAIEHDLLGGSVNVKSGEANYPSFAYRPDGWERDLPLTSSASMVSELTPIVLYLRNRIEPGDTLILEEPEAGLHPEAQAELVLLLARMVREGIRLVITTHSDWILEQFANLLRMSDLDEEGREGLRGAEAVLSREQFGAWMFSHEEDVGGTVVEEIKFDPDEGGIVSGFGPVAEDLYNTWAEVGNRLADRHLRDRTQ